MPAKNQPVKSFEAIARSDARVLVLGSMPGVASLSAAAYYAHPRNAFWPIAIASLSTTTIESVNLEDWPYQQRLELLLNNQIALWDVLAECNRPGSLDSAIERASVIANPIARFLNQHSTIARVVFNGKTAATMFNRHIKRDSDSGWADRKIELLTMPSTSPAMAQLSIDGKYRLWQPVFNAEVNLATPTEQ